MGAGRRTLLLLLAVAGAVLVRPPGALAYDWPLKPFDEQHAIRGYFNDPRREDLDGVLETVTDSRGNSAFGNLPLTVSNRP